MDTLNRFGIFRNMFLKHSSNGVNDIFSTTRRRKNFNHIIGRLDECKCSG